MTHTTPEVTKSGLTPAQAADVIRYYDASENEVSYRNGWRQKKVSLGLVAIHATKAGHSIIPDKDLSLAYTEPTLTYQEMAEGLEYILDEEQPEEVLKELPIEPTEQQWKEINKLSDTSGFPLYRAYAKIMGVWPN